MTSEGAAISENDMDDIGSLLSVENILPETFSALKRRVYSAAGEMEELVDSVQKIQNSIKRTRDAEKLKDSYLILGFSLLVLDRIQEAIEAFGKVGSRKETSFFMGKCYQETGEYAKANEYFELFKKGCTDEYSVQIQLEIAETKRKGGDAEEAKKIIERLYKDHKDNPELHYQLGHSLDCLGERDMACMEYEQALALDPNHAKALFRLAYNYDINGEDDEAIEYYERCNRLPVKYTNSFTNLGLLYEDKGENEKAVRCYETVLKSYPNDSRVLMYLEDAEASANMYYDEESSKRRAKEGDVLNVPISDFELSVRSRNCLEKMDIRTLGDLIKVTEYDLLSYKNFGETSLEEVKNMMAMRGLHLGQALEKQAGNEAE